MTSREKKGRCHRKCGNASKFSVGDTVGVSSHNLISHCKKRTQTIMFVQLRYGINFFNSRELSFRDQTLP